MGPPRYSSKIFQNHRISLYIWLVVTGGHFFYFPMTIGLLSSSQMTHSYFSEGFKPPTRNGMNEQVAGGWLAECFLWFSPSLKIEIWPPSKLWVDIDRFDSLFKPRYYLDLINTKRWFSQQQTFGFYHQTWWLNIGWILLKLEYRANMISHSPKEEPHIVQY